MALNDNWDEFIKSVGTDTVGEEPGAADLTAVVEFFKAVGLATPKFVTMDQEELPKGHGKYPKDKLGTIGILHRAMDELSMSKDAEYQIKTLTMKAAAESNVAVAKEASADRASSLIEQEVANAMRLLGNDNSALAVSRLLGSAREVNTIEMLQAGGMGAVRHHVPPPRNLLHILWAGTAAATSATPKRLPFCYVELPSNECTPGWLTKEVYGCKNSNMEELGFDDHSTTHMSKLRSLLDNASSQKYFFRKSTRYLIALAKWSVAALCCQQWSWVAFKNHQDVVSQLNENESAKTGPSGTGVAML